MYSIKKPIDLHQLVYTDCISRVKKAELKSRLTLVTPFATAGSLEFEKKVTTGQMHTIAREVMLNNNTDKKELELVYTYRMAKINAPGRIYYDRIILSAEYGICPMCSQREATTVDHYLPKSEYPRLTVSPINLIPCCKDCNDIKDAFYPTKDSEEFFHPYFDDISQQSWLSAKIEKTYPCTFTFFVDPPIIWSDLLARRIEFHFEKLQLKKLYSTQAAVELSMIRYSLENLYAKGGLSAVKLYLKDAEQSRSHKERNSWQAVFYRIAAKSNWFCNGGFR